MGNIIQPKDIFVLTDSLNFWWAVCGFEERYWDDIWIYRQRKDGSLECHATEVITRGWLRYLERTHDKEELEFDCDRLGMTLDELMASDRIQFAYSYDDPDDPDFYEVEFKAKRNKLGIKPCYIAVYLPQDKLTREGVVAGVRQYCREFLELPYVKVKFPRRMKRGFALKEYRREQKRMKEMQAFTDSGGTYEVRLLPEVLEQLFGTEEVERFQGEIDHGFYKDDQVYVRLKDGSERIFGPPDLKLIEGEEKKEDT